jgi:Transposase, Mutator family
MSYRWPADTDFTLLELDVLDRDCPACGRRMYICDHRYRRVHTLEGPLQLVCKLNHCPDPHCPGHTKTKSPEIEATIAPPQWAIGWDVLCGIGQRRFARHWAVPQIQTELLDAFGIRLSDTAITQFTHRYQTMVAARQQDPEHLRQHYEGVDPIILSIDGVQPEKGHETLYVVRELTQKRVWFAEPLLSASDDEVRRLIVLAKAWAEALGKTVQLWISDQQEAFVKGIAAVFPDVPHRSCAHHFLRDLAKPILEADSRAKVQMRKKVRGLRTIEKTVLEQQRSVAEDLVPVTALESDAPASHAPAETPCDGDDSATAVVLD